MFDNIGSKIKKLAKVLCWIGISVTALAGLLFALLNFEALFYDGNILIPLGLIFLGPLLSWIGSFVLYGFGQLVENSDIIRNKMMKD